MKPSSNKSPTLPKPPNHAVSPDSNRPNPQAPLSILTADGDPIIQRILRTTFERRGWFVCQAPDGRQALEYLQADPFDLVVFELNLAFLNGFELLDALGELPANRRVFSVVLSAQTQPESEVRAFERGVDDFIGKPVVPEILVARIDRLFKRVTMC